MRWFYSPRMRCYVSYDGRKVSELEAHMRQRQQADRTGRCPDCGKAKADYLTMDEAFTVFGHASSSCFTCKLTMRPRVVLASAPVPPID